MTRYNTEVFFIVLTCAVCLCIGTLKAQEIEGEFDRARCFFRMETKPLYKVYARGKDSFTTDRVEYDHYYTRVDVLNPCQSGYFIVRARPEGTDTTVEYNAKIAYGLMDTTGQIILRMNNQKLQIIRGFNATYFILQRALEWSLVNERFTPYRQSYERIIYLYSDGSGDYFFAGREKSKNNLNTRGDVIRISGGVVETVYEGLSWATDNYRGKGIFISQVNDSDFVLSTYRMDTLYRDFRIVKVKRRGSLFFIGQKNGRYYWIHPISSEKMVCLDTFDSYVHDEYRDDILYTKNGKAGAYLPAYWDYPDSFMHLRPVFDSIGESRNSSLHNGYVRGLWKGDTVFFVTDENALQFRTHFSSLYLINNPKNWKHIGEDGIYFRLGIAPIDWESLKPSGVWIGVNYNEREFTDYPANKRFLHTSIALEGGIGAYSFERSGGLMSDWEIYGGGIGFELRLPLDHNGEFRRLTGSSYRPLLLNARFEYGTGFTILVLPFGVHWQMGYATDFRDHYIRPGIGLSFEQLEIGGELLLPTNLRTPYYPQIGLYSRIILVAD